MHKDTVILLQMFKIQRKSLRNLAKLCPVFSTVKALVISPGPMKQKVSCTDTFVLHVSPMAKLSTKLKLIGKDAMENFQSTHTHSHRVLYNCNINNARSESHVHQQKAIHWYKNGLLFKKSNLSKAMLKRCLKQWQKMDYC